jgi:hypothetical protein
MAGAAPGVFNIEGGCYAKCIKLSKEGEPQIWNAIRFGSVLENVLIDDTTREPDYDSAAKTENTRVTYPVSYVPDAVIPSVGGHPKNVVFLSADAYGVLPPVSKLTPEQAMYYFINGYTSKLAGTEAGVTEPQPNFSACFGGVFLPRPPMVYAKQLAEKIRTHGTDVWLLNTGWTGGPYGIGSRFKLSYTRAFVTSILNGSLRNAQYVTHPIFGLHMPTSVPGVPAEVLDPAQDLEGRRRVRREGEGAREEVPRQRRQVRRDAGSPRGRAEGVTERGSQDSGVRSQGSWASANRFGGHSSRLVDSCTLGPSSLDLSLSRTPDSSILTPAAVPAALPMPTLLLDHSPRVGSTGLLGQTLREYGHRINVVRVAPAERAADALPGDLDDVDAIVLSDGPADARVERSGLRGGRVGAHQGGACAADADRRAWVRRAGSSRPRSEARSRRSRRRRGSR